MSFWTTLSLLCLIISRRNYQLLPAKVDILFFDEPTAALDRENKVIIFKTLEKLKKNKLIICSSHDDEAMIYADEIIDFNKLENLHTSFKKSSKSVDFEKNKTKKKRKLQPFMNKLYSFPGREKKSRIILIIVFVLAFFSLCICDTPENKTESNIEYTYHLNQIQVTCHGINQLLLQKFANDKNILEVVLMYNKSVPDGIVNEGDIYSNVDYNLTALTLPFNKNAFRLSDRIAYGSYFTKAEQIILSYEMAISMGGPEDLIGETLKVKMYDRSYDMEIVGVFRKFNEIKKQYLWASGVSWQEDSKDTFFINGEFTKRYIYDKNFLMHGERGYTLYFNTFDNMKSGYKYYKANESGAMFSYARGCKEICV